MWFWETVSGYTTLRQTQLLSIGGHSINSIESLGELNFVCIHIFIQFIYFIAYERTVHKIVFARILESICM